MTSTARRKREPVAVPLAEGGVLVKHTHDLDVAQRLARANLAFDNDLSEANVNLPDARAVWVRITHCLPSSNGEAMGWAWQYHYCTGPARGVFPAVEFIP